jgi:hypothetical protein
VAIEQRKVPGPQMAPDFFATLTHHLFPIRAYAWPAFSFPRLMDSQNENALLSTGILFFNRIFVCALSFRRGYSCSL